MLLESNAAILKVKWIDKLQIKKNYTWLFKSLRLIRQKALSKLQNVMCRKRAVHHSSLAHFFSQILWLISLFSFYITINTSCRKGALALALIEGEKVFWNGHEGTGGQCGYMRPSEIWKIKNSPPTCTGASLRWTQHRMWIQLIGQQEKKEKQHWAPKMLRLSKRTSRGALGVPIGNNMERFLCQKKKKKRFPVYLSHLLNIVWYLADKKSSEFQKFGNCMWHFLLIRMKKVNDF